MSGTADRWADRRARRASPQHGDGEPGERRGSFLAALADAADVGAAFEDDVAAGQADELGDPQPGLDGEDEHGVVAPAGPGAAVGCGEERVDLGVGEPGDGSALVAFGRDGEHALDGGGVFGVVQRGVAEQRVDGGEPPVAGADRVVPVDARGGPRTRRSAARRDRRCRAPMASCRSWRWRSRPAAGTCRGSRRWCGARRVVGR